jgi:hypothetical protein
LKNEINNLQKQLDEAAEKYVNREPRVKDVELIDSLTKKNSIQSKTIQGLNV